MAANTATWALTYPQSTDDVRPYEDIQELATDVDGALTLLKSQLPNVRYYYERLTDGTATTTTEQPYFRVDNIAVVSGQFWVFNLSPMIIDSTIAGDLVEVRLRYAIGATATIASTAVCAMVESAHSSAISQKVQGFQVGLKVPSTGNLSALVSYVRGSGTGSVRIRASSSYPAQLIASLGTFETLTAAGTSL